MIGLIGERAHVGNAHIKEIKIGYVVRIIDGPLAPIACASRTAYRGCRHCKGVTLALFA